MPKYKGAKLPEDEPLPKNVKKDEEEDDEDS